MRYEPDRCNNFPRNGPPYAFRHFLKSNFATSATWRMGKKSSYIKNILGFSYLHAYPTFAPWAELKFEKSSKSSHPNTQSHGKERNVFLILRLLTISNSRCHMNKMVIFLTYVNYIPHSTLRDSHSCYEFLLENPP